MVEDSQHRHRRHARHQEAWIAFAREHTCRQIDAETRRQRPGGVPRKQDRLGTPAPRFALHVSLDARGQAELEAVKEKLSRECGRAVGDDEIVQIALDMLLRAAPQPGDDGRGAERVRHDSPCRVVVQRCPSCADAAVLTKAGPLALDPAAAAMVACEAPVLDPEGTAEPVPKWLRDAVLARDGYRCRCCSRKHGLTSHHIVPRELGGPNTVDNLLALCAHCHGRLHAGLLRIEGNARTARFVGKDGTPLDRQVRFQSLPFRTPAAARRRGALTLS